MTTPERLDPREPELVRAGWFDASFVLVHVLPLAVLMLTATLITEEREAGTWPAERDFRIALRVARNAVRFDANEQQAAAALRAPDGHAARIRAAFVHRYPAVCR